MHVTGICPACHQPEPQSFAALMEMYEANYIRLRQLIPDLISWSDKDIRISEVDGALSLYARLEEITQYTVTLWLSYDFGESCPKARYKPDLLVRVYLDARQAEVLSRTCRFDVVDMRRQKGDVDTLLACKWRLNRFLYKWLGYCLRQEHQISTRPGSHQLAAG